jgi:uncharacterized protein YndB with AHSA1/START domain
MNDNSAARDTSRSVIVECDLDEPPEKVWRALTVPEFVARWLMPNDMRAEIGSRFTLKTDDAKGGDIACEVLAAEPNRYLRYSWRGDEGLRDAEDRPLDTVVTFILTETETGGTHLRLVHGGFPATSSLAAQRCSAEPLVWAVARRATRRRRDPRALHAYARMTIQGRMRWAA